MDERGMVQLSDVTHEEARLRRALDYVVAFRWVAAVGALTAAIAPAIMATADGTELRGSVSAYWNVDPRYYFWAPFTIGAVLLAVDGVLSYLSPNRIDFGGRWYNVVLGVALAVLTWFDLDNDRWLHYPAATVFFVLFIAVIAYTSLLGWAGRHLQLAGDDTHNRQVEIMSARVSLVFLGLLLLTLIAWVLGLLNFFFFEVFALVNFALHYVQGSVNPFPYNHYEFRIDWLNSVLRALRIMRTPDAPAPAA